MFDVAIVGGGPAGLSAALMLGRCRRSVLVLDLRHPRNQRSHALHGYLTRDRIAPASLIELGRAELSPYGIELRAIGVTGAQLIGDHYRLALANGGAEEARYVLIATGVVIAVYFAESFSLGSWIGGLALLVFAWIGRSIAMGEGAHR